MAKRTGIALLLFGGLLGLLLWARTVPEKGERTQARPGPFTPIPADQIARVTVQSADRKSVV